MVHSPFFSNHEYATQLDLLTHLFKHLSPLILKVFSHPLSFLFGLQIAPSFITNDFGSVGDSVGADVGDSVTFGDSVGADVGDSVTLG